MADHEAPGPTPLTAFLSACVFTIIVVAVLEGAGALAWSNRTGVDMKRGWFLVPALVAAHDLDEGATLTAADVETGRFPEQFVTASLLKPELRSQVEGRRLDKPVKKGDVLTVGLFERSALPPNCAPLARSAVKELGLEGDGDVQQFLEQLEARRPKDGGRP